MKPKIIQLTAFDLATFIVSECKDSPHFETAKDFLKFVENSDQKSGNNETPFLNPDELFLEFSDKETEFLEVFDMEDNYLRISKRQDVTLNHGFEWSISVWKNGCNAPEFGTLLSGGATEQNLINWAYRHYAYPQPELKL